MNVNDLLNTLRTKEINLEINEKGNLDIKSPKGALTKDIIEHIRDRKQEIVDYLHLVKAGAAQGNSIPAAQKLVSYPLSSAQMRLWLLEQINKGFTAYNIPKVQEIAGSFDPVKAEQAFRQLILRHEILRTVFVEDETTGVRQQVIPAAEANFRLPFSDYTGDPAAPAIVEKMIAADKEKPFQLNKGPLFRAMLFRLAEERYVLYCNMHHIISDGWSVNIFSREFMHCYEALCQGGPASLPPLSIQYKDYAVWQQEQLSTGALEASRRYWLQQFQGPLPVLDLPVANTRPAVFTHHGEVLSVMIGRHETNALRHLCGQQQATLFMGLLGVLQVLLYRYTGQQDFIIGTPVAGREHPALQEQIGLYVNTLALRTRFNGQDTFAALLQHVRETTLTAYEYQSYPFDRLVEELNIPRDLSRSPLFDMMVVLHNEREHLPHNGSTGGENEILSGGSCAVKFDLNIDFTEVGDALFMRLAYNSDIYTKDTMTALLRHFIRLLQVLPEQTVVPLSLVRYLSREEEERLHRLNPPMVTRPTDKTLMALFREQVIKNPHQPALLYHDGALGYQELDDKSNQVAAYLMYKGIGQQMLVPVLMDRSPELLIAILGILKAGAVYVPVDPANAPGRISYILEETAATLVITDDASRVPGQQGRYILLIQDLLAQTADLSAEAVPLLPAAAGTLTCVIYTSGSTGHPKGVMIREQGLLNRLYWMWTHYPFSAGERSAWKTTSSFADHMWELFGPLLQGVPSVLFTKEEVLDPSFVTLLSTYRVTRLVLVPALLQVILDIVRENGVGELWLPTHWTSSGEPLTTALMQDFHTLLPGRILLNIYGSSEVTADVTCLDTRDAVAWQGRTVPIGKPIDNIRIYILDSQLQLLPAGYPGEICVSGAGLSAGYFQREELDREKFVSHPFFPGENLFRTGDTGRWLPDGNLFCSGRTDDQLKIRGVRVEPGEIAHALRQLEYIDDAVVIADTRKAGDSVLVAYLISAIPLDEEAIRQQLTTRLPDYMIPACFVQLEKFPLTVSGKIDKRALPLPEMETVSAGLLFKAPETALEKQMAAIWQRVLNSTASIGTNTDFFTAGGHSLRLMQLSNHYSRELGVKLTMQQLFRHTTIAAQIPLITGSAQAVSAAILPVPPADSYAVSDGQRRMWVINQLGDAATAYNLSSYFTLPADVVPELLERAVSKLIARHEILRTVFRETEDDRLHQVVLPVAATTFRLECYETTDAAAAAERLREPVTRPFDLAVWPLVRAGIVRTGNACTGWICMHHIISDGWSMEIVKEEVIRHYQAALQQEEVVLPPLPVQYKDYAAWQQARLSGDEAAACRDYWLQQFSGVLPVLELPLSYQRPPLKTYNGHALSVHIPIASASALHALCREQGASLFMGLTAILHVLLYRYSGQEDIIIGTPIAGRDHAALEEQIGFYVNTLAIRMPFSGEDNFPDVLKHMREVVLQAFEHQWYPFDRLVEELRLKRDISRSPLFDVMLVLHNERRTIPTDITEAGIRDEGQQPVKFDLQLDVSEYPDGSLRVKLTGNTGLFALPAIAQLLRHYVQLLAVLPVMPATPVKCIGFLLPEERQQLLTDFNNTAVVYPEGRTLTSLFYEQAALRGGEVALIHQNRSFTWKELDEYSSRLAHYLLQQYSLSAEDLVCICLPRSEWLIISLLAVLKAGGAYVPIDPAYPEDRIRFIREDSNSKVCIDASWLAAYRASSQEYPVTHPEVIITENRLAYVLYTSGSTGQPKGCMLEHRGVVNRLVWMWEHYGYTAADTVLQKTTYTFDVSVWELFLPLCLGCRMVLCEDEDIYMPDRLLALIRDHQVTNLHFVPGMLQAFISSLWDDEANIRVLSGLRLVVTSGEALSPRTVQHWHEKLSVPVANLYGPTEASVDVSYYDTAPGQSIIPIGKPVANTSLYILDGEQQLVPLGVTGEIYIGGVQLARGYLNRPELTADRFLPDPFSKTPGARMYRTGDLGRWQADGNILYAGRSDHQVKIRGFRIEPGEIEYAISCDTGGAAVVLPGRDVSGEQCLSAYYTGDMAPLTLRKQLQQRLPAHMIPAYFIRLEKLPLTFNGKTDRAALSAMATRDPDTEAVQPAVTETAVLLVTLLKQVLDIPAIGVNTDFFNAGGNSMKAIWLVNQLKKHGWYITVTDILRYPLVGELAARLTPIAPEVPALPAETGARNIPGPENMLDLSFNQLIYCHADGFTNACGTFSIYLPVFDKAAVTAAYHRLLDEHVMLRMKFIRKDNRIYQQLQPLDSIATQIDFIYREEIDVADPEIQEKQHAMIHTPFNLTAGEVVRCAVLHNSGTAVVFFAIHHIVTDHFSNQLLKAAFAGYLNGTAVPPASPPSGYPGFIRAQQHFLQSAAAQEEKDFWNNRLKNVLQAFRQKPVKPVQDRWLHERQVVDRENIALFCKNNHLFLSSYILGAYFITDWLVFPAEQNKLLKMTVNGHDSAVPGFQTNGVAGVFVNSIPVDACCYGELTLTEMLAAVQENYLQARNNQHIPIQVIRESCINNIGTDPVDYFSGSFNYLPIQDDYHGASVSGAYVMEGADIREPYHSYLRCLEYNNALVLEWRINADSAAATTENLYSRAMQRVIDTIIHHPETTLSGLQKLIHL